MKLTIAIPSYNGGNALIEAVESCKYIDIDINNYEVLVIDNCSNDGSIEILRSTFSDYKPLRIEKNESNIGRIPNWNKCLSETKGEYILFLFSNDLLMKENNVKVTLEFFDKFPTCSICSVPWIISDFKMNKMFSAPQYYVRTPGVGSFESEKHIKQVLESGKLPFVCLQSNFLRKNHISDSGLRFNDNFPITSDGIFLSEIAIFNKEICFFDKASVIWRQDAPNRLHANIQLQAHMEQFFKTFLILKIKCTKEEIDISNSFANYNGFEYVYLEYKKNGMLSSIKLFAIWLKLAKSLTNNKINFIKWTVQNINRSLRKFCAKQKN